MNSPEILGTTCADGGTCHHHCKTKCFRKDCCVPLSGSGLADDWTRLKPLTPLQAQLNYDMLAISEFYQHESQGLAAIDDCRKIVCDGQLVQPPGYRPEIPIQSTEAVVTNIGHAVHNGMLTVDLKEIKYRGFTIKNKLDMGDHPWQSHGNSTRTGWVILDENSCNCMPGAAWSSDLLACRAMIDIWIESEFNGEKFWELMGPYRY